jgi:hypothetical protein
VPNNTTPAPTGPLSRDPIEVVTPALPKVATVSSSSANRQIHDIQIFLAPMGNMDSKGISDPLWVPLILHKLNLGFMVSFFSCCTTRVTDRLKARQEGASCFHLLRQRPQGNLCRSHPPIALKVDLRVDLRIQSRQDNTTSDLHPHVIRSDANLVVDIRDSHSSGLVAVVKA